MKKIIWVISIAVGILALTAVAAAFTKWSAKPANPVTLPMILQAHNLQNADALSATVSEARRFTYYSDSGSNEKQNFFERKVVVSTYKDEFKVFKSDPLDVRRQTITFDGGATGFYADLYRGQLLKEPTELEGSKLISNRFFVHTFGLIYILKQLSDPSTEVVWLGNINGQDKFRVTVPNSAWTIYVDHKHLIHRAELGKVVIDYGDYREVNGIQLPFFQRLSVGGSLIYELSFTRIELGQTFPPDYFKKEAIAQDINY